MVAERLERALGRVADQDLRSPLRDRRAVLPYFRDLFPGIEGREEIVATVERMHLGGPRRGICIAPEPLGNLENHFWTFPRYQVFADVGHNAGVMMSAGAGRIIRRIFSCVHKIGLGFGIGQDERVVHSHVIDMNHVHSRCRPGGEYGDTPRKGQDRPD